MNPSWALRKEVDGGKKGERNLEKFISEQR